MTDTFIVSARKYRPQSWDAVVGQSSITSTLKNAISQGQIAQAYLFCGPRGVGKTTCARIFAQEINAEAKKEDEDLSFNVFELDAASNNSVEDIRSLTEQVRIPPQIGKYKVYIIDEVHMLSQSAFNAFLKTLEEPPPHAIFILATTEKHKIIPTILSRCQIYDFNRIQVPSMVSHLKEIADKEGVVAEEEALHIIAQKADGALRDALSIFDQLVAFCGKSLTYSGVIENLNVLDHEFYFKITQSFIDEKISDSLLILDEIINNGFDPHHFITGLGEHLRDLMVCKDPATVKLMEVADSVKERYVEQANAIDIRVLIKALEFVNQCDVGYKTSNNQRLLVEFALISICSINYNLQEKKNSDFVLKPFKESQSALLKKQIRSIPKQTNVKEQLVQSNSKSIKTAEKPLVVGSGPQHKYPFGAPLLTELLKDKKVQSSEDSEPNDHAKSNDHDSLKQSDDFSLGQLHEAWKEFAERFRQTEPNMFNTLMAKMPTVVESKITFELHNSYQEDKVKGIRGDIIGYLKNKLNNSLIEIEVVRIEEVDDTKRLYTDVDKFKAMNEKNPNLDYFRQKFNLDLEF